MNTHEIRQKYLDYFQNLDHAILPSAKLIPENDPTTLFTGSGMQPMVPYLLGQEHPAGKRLADSQKCFRSQDIEEVGDNRHTTFFEMLGNWSLGDYFKSEQIPWMFSFLINELDLDPSRLYVSCYAGNETIGIERDIESAQMWKEQFASIGLEAEIVENAEEAGMQGGRIFYFDDKKNWWSRVGTPDKMPSGEPGGPDTEMFYDFGEELGLHEASEFADQPCHINCDCGRFLEIGNNVFMQYQKTDDGFAPLPNQNVDFGGGLERIAAALNGDPDIFKISLFADARKMVEEASGKEYGSDEETTYAMRVILDHLRASTFLISDGVPPSNKDQGYFVRRLIRRAVRFGRRLGMEGAFCGDIAAAYIQTYTDAYPELAEQKNMILDELSKEEEKFSKTLAKGEREFEKMFSEAGEISGEDAFTLYATYGFPLELTQEMAQEHGQHIDLDTFRLEFKKHQDLSRAGSQQKFAGGLADHSEKTVALHTATHLLHQALRTVLGEHVFQRGSNITPDRLRFDFSHPEKMTPEQKAEVERLVNEQIQADKPVHYEVLDVDAAKERGAIGVFDDKYAQMGGQVKVYFVGDEAADACFSKEVCGGPHVERTGSMGHFRIKKEESSSSGIRRIKAVLE